MDSSRWRAGLVGALRHTREGLQRVPLVRSYVEGLEGYLTTTPTLRTVEVTRDEWEAASLCKRISLGASPDGESGEQDGLGHFHSLTMLAGDTDDGDEGLLADGQMLSHAANGIGAAAGPAGGHGGASSSASGPRDRSVIGMPILSCNSRGYAAWTLFIIMLDLTCEIYMGSQCNVALHLMLLNHVHADSAFFLPISIGFQASVAG